MSSFSTDLQSESHWSHLQGKGVDEYIDKKKEVVEQSIKESQENIIFHLLELINQYGEENIVIVTSGKSRRLTERYLSEIFADEELSQYASLYANRLRLNSDENKRVYSEKPEEASSVLKKFDSQKVYIFIDDFSNIGRKIFWTLENLSQLNIQGHYIVIAGPAEWKPSDYLPPNINPYVDQVFVGSQNKDFQEYMNRISRELSMLVSEKRRV